MYINPPRFRPPRSRLVLTATTLAEFQAEAAVEAAARVPNGRFPVTRWVALTPDGVAYYFWQHEKLGWWAWSTAFAREGRPARWRPIVAPLMLVVRQEGMTLTFTDWPPTCLERHDWHHQVGPIARVGTNPRSGWPGEPPVAVLLAEAA